jgi:ParB family chromosome partitioning protein
LIVRPKEGYPDIYQIIAGERRWRAAQKARVHEVAVLVTEHDDETVLEIALVENLQREDLNPLEEARGYRQLIDQHGHTQEDVAKAIGKSRSHVANMVRLLNLPESVQKMLEKGELSSGHARSLVTADDPEAMAEEIIFRGLNVRQAEELAGKASEKSSSKTRPPKKQKDPDTRALEEEVSLALGMKVTIHMKSKGAGKLDVEFKNLDQLDEILHRISHYPGSRQNG